MKPKLKKAEILLTNIHDTIEVSSPYWLLKQPVVILNLTKFIKKNTHYQEKLFNIQEKYSNYSQIYTDGSQDRNRTRCGAVFNSKTRKRCLPKEAFIFTTKTCALELAFDIVWTSNSKRFVIHSDSFSVLLSIKNWKLDNLLIIKLLNILNSMSLTKRWILRHIGI